MHRYQELKFWQKSKDLCVDLYRLTGTFPDNEKFGLVSQMRRASVSIASNIAEGSSRNSNKEFCRLLEIANGSAYELETQLLLSKEIGYLTDESHTQMNSKLTTVILMLNKFKSTL